MTQDSLAETRDRPIGCSVDGGPECIICEKPIQEHDMVQTVYQAEKRFLGGLGAISKNLPYYIHFDCMRAK